MPRAHPLMTDMHATPLPPRYWRPPAPRFCRNRVIDGRTCNARPQVNSGFRSRHSEIQPDRGFRHKQPLRNEQLDQVVMAQTKVTSD